MSPQVKELETQIELAAKRGDERQLHSLLGKLLELDPNHPTALGGLSQRAFRQGDAPRARELLQRLIAVDGAERQHWINLAVVCQSMNDEAGEDEAIKGALTIDPMDLMALLMRGKLRERQGRVHEAASAYSGVLAVAPPMAQLVEHLRPAVAQAAAFREKYNQQYGDFIDTYLAPFYQELDGAREIKRFRESVDIMFGRKKRYESQSMLFHYHGLAPITFFDRKEFPWMEALEAQTDAIRNEFLNVMGEANGFQPYLEYAADHPHNQFAELNNSLRWTAFHLIKDGKPVAGNSERCPITMAAMAATPMPDQPGRTPTAMFSLLKPNTRIPPHVGVSNARLVVHLPLIVPPGCGFRVGNDTRGWEPGHAFVFDDTIEHEAWNNSDQQRVVLIFDTWHPHLTEAERKLCTAMSAGVQAFAAGSGGFDL